MPRETKRPPAPAVPAVVAAAPAAVAVVGIAVARAAVVVGLALMGLSVAGGSGEGGAAGMRNGGSARCVLVPLAADGAADMHIDFTFDGTS